MNQKKKYVVEIVCWDYVLLTFLIAVENLWIDPKKSNLLLIFCSLFYFVLRKSLLVIWFVSWFPMHHGSRCDSFHKNSSCRECGKNERILFIFIYFYNCDHKFSVINKILQLLSKVSRVDLDLILYDCFLSLVIIWFSL